MPSVSSSTTTPTSPYALAPQAAPGLAGNFKAEANPSADLANELSRQSLVAPPQDTANFGGIPKPSATGGEEAFVAQQLRKDGGLLTPVYDLFGAIGSGVSRLWQSVTGGNKATTAPKAG
jgi:hypothetical protein